MKSLALTIVAALCCAVTLFAAPASAQTSDTRTVTRGGWQVTFTPDWFTAQRGGRTIAMGDYFSGEPDGCEIWDERGRMLSIVGTVVTFKHTTFGYCGGAHNLADTRFVSIDLAKGGAPVRPVDLFDEAKLDEALAADSAWQKAQKNGGEFECIWLTRKNTLGGAFAFHHLEDGKVAIRIGVGDYAAGACRGQYIQLGLYVPVPERLEQDLKEVAKEETLMINMLAPVDVVGC